MNLDKHTYIYQISVKNRRIVKVISPNKKNHFEAPATGNASKLYIVADAHDILYVGITKQPIRNRLRIGQNPNESTGYHGYKWLSAEGEYSLLIYIDSQSDDLEAVEAEVVYNIRKEEHQWPKFQNEIHFHNTNEKQKKLARNIYSYVRSKIDGGILGS